MTNIIHPSFRRRVLFRVLVFSLIETWSQIDRTYDQGASRAEALT